MLDFMDKLLVIYETTPDMDKRVSHIRDLRLGISSVKSMTEFSDGVTCLVRDQVVRPWIQRMLLEQEAHGMCRLMNEATYTQSHLLSSICGFDSTAVLRHTDGKKDSLLLTGAQQLGLRYAPHFRRSTSEVAAECEAQINGICEEFTSTWTVTRDARLGRPTIIVVFVMEDASYTKFLWRVDRVSIEPSARFNPTTAGFERRGAVLQYGDRYAWVEFRRVPREQYAFALLRLTVSPAYYSLMRQRAIDIGLRLDEHGFTPVRPCDSISKIYDVLGVDREYHFFRLRLHGTFEDLMNEYHAKGKRRVTAVLARNLFEAGFRTMEDIHAADPKQLMNVKGVKHKMAAMLQE